MLKATLTVLAGTLTFSFSLLRQVGAKQVPTSGVSAAGSLLVLSLALFRLFFDRFIHRLRPVTVAGLVGQVARQVIIKATQTAEADTASAQISVDSAKHQDQKAPQVELVILTNEHGR